MTNEHMTTGRTSPPTSATAKIIQDHALSNSVGSFFHNFLAQCVKGTVTMLSRQIVISMIKIINFKPLPLTKRFLDNFHLCFRAKILKETDCDGMKLDTH
jgi:hypothetical protein